MICRHCRKSLDTNENVSCVDGSLQEVVHESCYNEYILTKHTAETYCFKAFAQLRKESDERLQKISDRLGGYNHRKR